MLHSFVKDVLIYNGYVFIKGNKKKKKKKKKSKVTLVVRHNI